MDGKMDGEERPKYIALREEGESALFMLPNYSEISGEVQYLLWNQSTRRYQEVDKFTKGRSERCIRHVVRVEEGGNKHGMKVGEHILNMTRTTNRAFLNMIDTLKATGTEPLDVIFRITRHGQGLQTTYEITLETGWLVDEAPQKVE